MNTEYYKKYEPIFNTWYIKSLLGEGSFGKVFEIERQDFGVIYKAALKAITIPQSQSEIKSIMADGMDEASATSYFRQVVEDLVSEFVLMSKLKGNSNTVSYEDHIVLEHTEGIGWDILIRMELLTPLIDHIHKEKLSRKDVIKLGIDLCKALELCQKYNIVHRDIKPENIFISENGDYKLGDFGIARTLEKTTGVLSKKGTYVYMAPEIYRDEEYGSNVDIYSLGIVMYRLLNENRTPFLPAYPAPITYKDREAAIKKRISGAVLPKPANADGRLAEIVLKACAYNPKDRYFAPMEMREELEAILYNKEEAKIIYPKGDDTPIKSIEYVETGKEALAIQNSDKTDLTINSNSQEHDKTESLITQGTVNKTESVFGAYEKDFENNKCKDNVFIDEKPKLSRFLLIAAIVCSALSVINIVNIILYWFSVTWRFFLSCIPLILVTAILIVLCFKWKKSVDTAMRVTIVISCIATIMYSTISIYNFTNSLLFNIKIQNERIEIADQKVIFNDSHTYWVTDYADEDDEFYAVLNFTSKGVVTEYGISFYDSFGMHVSGLDSLVKVDAYLEPGYQSCLFKLSAISPNGQYYSYLNFGATYQWSGYVICDGQRYESPQYSFLFSAEGSHLYNMNYDEFIRLIDGIKTEGILLIEPWSYGSLIYDEGYDRDGNLTDFRIILFDDSHKVIEILDGNYNLDGDGIIRHSINYNSDDMVAEYWYRENGGLEWYAVTTDEGSYGYYIFNYDDVISMIDYIKTEKNGEILLTELWSYGSVMEYEGLDMNGNPTDFRIILFDDSLKFIEILDGNYDLDGDWVIKHIIIYNSDYEYTDYWYGENGKIEYYVVNTLDDKGNVIDAKFYYEDGTLFDVNSTAEDER